MGLSLSNEYCLYCSEIFQVYTTCDKISLSEKKELPFLLLTPQSFTSTLTLIITI